MAPFYITVVVHFIFVFLILFVLPESLSTQSRIILTKNAEIARANKKRRDAAEREWENETPAAAEVGDPLLAHAQSSWSLRSNGGGVISKRRKRIYGRSRRFIKRAFHFLEPLGIFLPRDRRDDEDWDGRRGKDWNMTLVGVALFLMSLMMVCCRRRHRPRRCCYFPSCSKGERTTTDLKIIGNHSGQDSIHVLCLRMDFGRVGSLHVLNGLRERVCFARSDTWYVFGILGLSVKHPC